MSLVAYDASSDEESDYEDNGVSKVVIVGNASTAKNPAQSLSVKAEVSNGCISDEDEFIPQCDEKEKHLTNLSKLLPKPKKETHFTEILESFSKPTFDALPVPKSVNTQIEIEEEEDDEFLRKVPSKEVIENTNKYPEVRKPPVKIIVPSLKNFQDVEKELAEKARNKNKFCNSKPTNSSDLLSILPKAKSEQCFAKDATSSVGTIKPNAIRSAEPPVTSFIPDSVKHRRPATNTEDVERFNSSKKSVKQQINKVSIQNDVKLHTDDSDDDNSGDEDFFSFNTDQSLPEVSVREINSLVAEKTAKIFEASTKFLKTTETTKLSHEDMQKCEHESELSRKRYHEQQSLNSEDLQALVGGNTKRRRQQSSVQVIELNSSQVMPNKDEWMRTALASSTSYQPTGVLVDEEPASGTRRKHQITYLAHKAKANEAELQAMWSANRQNRRATQSKYGF